MWVGKNHSAIFPFHELVTTSDEGTVETQVAEATDEFEDVDHDVDVDADDVRSLIGHPGQAAEIYDQWWNRGSRLPATR